jgi:hypothetical protein
LSPGSTDFRKQTSKDRPARNTLFEALRIDDIQFFYIMW